MVRTQTHREAALQASPSGMLHLILGGAALQGCGNCFVLNSASAAEVEFFRSPLAVHFCKVSNRVRLKAAEKVGNRPPAPKGAADFEELMVSLKRYPDTKPELVRKL